MTIWKTKIELFSNVKPLKLKLNESYAKRIEEIFDRNSLDNLNVIKRLLDEAKCEAVEEVNAQLAKLRDVKQMGKPSRQIVVNSSNKKKTTNYFWIPMRIFFSNKKKNKFFLLNFWEISTKIIYDWVLEVFRLNAVLVSLVDEEYNTRIYVYLLLLAG